MTHKEQQFAASATSSLRDAQLWAKGWALSSHAAVYYLSNPDLLGLKKLIGDEVISRAQKRAQQLLSEWDETHGNK